MLEAWHFPDYLVASVKHADHPAGAPDEHRNLMAHLHAAKFIATAIGAGVAEDGFLMELDSDLLINEGFNPDKLIAIQCVVLEKVSLLLKEQMTDGPVKF